MKNYSFIAFFITALVMAQQPPSDLNKTQDALIDPSSPSLFVEKGSSNPAVLTYATLNEFQAAVSTFCMDDTLTSENFEGGPTTISLCGASIGSFGNICFDAGELEDGFVVESSDLDDIVYVPDGGLANVEDPMVGANNYFYHTIIKFDPEIYAMGLEIWVNVEQLTQVRIFGEGGELIELINIETPPFTQTFFGVIADEPIERIEVEGAHKGAELVGKFLYGAVCENIAGVDDNILSQVSVYPNPASHYVTVQLPSDVELQSIVIHDVMGKIISKEILHNQINVSHFTRGIYFLTIQTSRGMLTRKISKR